MNLIRLESNIGGFQLYLNNIYLSHQYIQKRAKLPQNSNIGIPPEYIKQTKIVLRAKALLEATLKSGSNTNSFNYF